MATGAHPLINDYKACKLIKLDPAEPHSPLVLVQQGYLPHDPQSRVRLFFLQRDGMWIDEIGRSTLPDSEAGKVVFDTVAEVLEVISRLAGPPLVREVPVTDADVRAYMARVKSVGSPETAFQDFLARYRRSKP